MESGVCEEQLNQVETLLQTVRREHRAALLRVPRMQRCNCVRLQEVRMLSSGRPAQHTAEMDADLDKAEGMIRFLFNDVQLLKDGRHLQAEQMYRRCKNNNATMRMTDFRHEGWNV